MLNILIPMAGAGSRFVEKGYALPKPLIPIHNLEMIRVVINNLRPNIDHRFIFIVQHDHSINFGIKDKLLEWERDSVVIETDGLTEGAACTALLAEDYIDSNTPLIIANSDQYIDIDINDFIKEFMRQSYDGLIMTMTANDPKWSYVATDKNLVTQVVEKIVISNEATVGIYSFKKGSDFVRAAKLMISNNSRVNNEFYVAPTYNELILNDFKIGYFNIGSEGYGMYGLGIPIDLENFLINPVSYFAINLK
jgi:NDP-sugar pyrophosphorylase family protein